MLNAVKHLYRIVILKEDIGQRVRNSVAVVLHCISSNARYLLLLTCMLLVNTSKAQNYPIKALDGSNATIQIQNRTTTTAFTISCPTDKLILPNYWADGKIKVLNRRFLEIIYYVRGGSGVGIGNTLLLCINHGKLQQAMHISSYSYNLEEGNELINNTKILLDIDNTAHTTIYDTVRFENPPKPSRIIIRENTVKFNTAQGVFCNYQKKIDTTLGSYNYKTNRVSERHFSGIAPAFRLDGCEYIFIAGLWYNAGKNGKNYFLIN